MGISSKEADQPMAARLNVLPGEIRTEVLEDEAEWFAVHTRARHEKKVALDLERAQVETFLPTVHELHNWSDRRKEVEVPLFSCYVFVHIRPASRERLVVQTTGGVLAFAGSHGGTPIPAEEIDAIRSVVRAGMPFERCPFQKGQRVRVRGGALEGVVGVLQSDPHQEKRLMISIEAIHQSLLLSVEGYRLEAV
jgi:transcriptional antiterminator NusG